MNSSFKKQRNQHGRVLSTKRDNDKGGRKKKAKKKKKRGGSPESAWTFRMEQNTWKVFIVVIIIIIGNGSSCQGITLLSCHMLSDVINGQGGP